jgi:hypothetical protein
MRIVHGDQVEEKIRIHQHRQGMFAIAGCLGEPARPAIYPSSSAPLTISSPRRSTISIVWLSA